MRKSAYGGSPLRKFDAPRTHGGPLNFQGVGNQEQNKTVYEILKNT